MRKANRKELREKERGGSVKRKPLPPKNRGKAKEGKSGKETSASEERSNHPLPEKVKEDEIGGNMWV